MSENLLKHEDSPYLLQHQDNPVHWRPWGEAALKEAQDTDKPILLSVGYAACHWCHVMAHESFENPNIAALMNELFVPIKVDREERPDIDAIYQTALSLLGQQGGWPLTMFLTPKGEPFWGGTYFPATERYGRPVFPNVLGAISKLYREEPDKVAQNVGALTNAITELSQPQPGNGLTMAKLDEAAHAAAGLIDRQQGGTTGAPKFPMPSFFRFLWRAYRRSDNADYKNAVTVTLDAMSQGGIYDHLGGGYARYSTDAVWLAPHFEKMLYDNAQIIDLLTEVWQETRSPLYAQRIAETIDWMARDLTVTAADGLTAFASAFDADSEGEEGKFYVWSNEEIDTLLGEHAALFKSAYDVTPYGNWEGKCILNRSAKPELQNTDTETILAGCLDILLGVRAKRIAPGRDDKALADWNGLAIAALANAGAVFERPEWLAMAEGAFNFVLAHMTEGGRLGHSWCAGRLRHAAVLDDYADLSRAALILFDVTHNAAYLVQAEAWVAIAEAHYRDDEGGGYYFTADDTTDVIARTKQAQDNATPAGNGVMVEVLARLFHLTGTDTYRQRAEESIRAFTAGTAAHLAHSSSLLMGFEMLERAVQIVIIGTPGEPATEALRRCVFDTALANRLLLCVAPGDDLPPGHLATGKTQTGGQATAYVCVGPLCGLPASTPGALRERLAG